MIFQKQGMWRKLLSMQLTFPNNISTIICSWRISLLFRNDSLYFNKFVFNPEEIFTNHVLLNQNSNNNNVSACNLWIQYFQSYKCFHFTPQFNTEKRVQTRSIYCWSQHYCEFVFERRIFTKSFFIVCFERISLDFLKILMCSGF